jgi:ubiquinone/menaquinone biosynthesis C-methylase UbiE
MNNYDNANNTDFSSIAPHYEATSLVQNEASAGLFELVDIQPQDHVLDLGCGPGHLTAKIAQKTANKVVGYDSSKGMVQRAQDKYGGPRMEFHLRPVEAMADEDRFDLIFCNSVFQWFREPQKALAHCYRSLKKAWPYRGSSAWLPGLFSAIHRCRPLHPQRSPYERHFFPFSVTLDFF